MLKIKQLPGEAEGFNANPCIFCDTLAVLVTPAMQGTKWTARNLMFRSSVWVPVTGEGFELVSASFPKFFNFGEKPSLYPDPEHFKDWDIQHKQDGTCVIVDYYNGELNMRIRGTSWYGTQANAADFLEVVTQHPSLELYLKENNNLSLLFELETPNNVLVVRSETVKVTFLAAIDKNTYTFVDTAKVAADICAKTPEKYQFKKLADIVSSIKEWKGQEGVVLTYNKGQNRVKLKSDWYLRCHRIKSELNSENNLIELYVSLNLPSYQEFYDYVETSFDYEIAQQLRGQISKMADAGKEVTRIVEGMKQFTSEIRNFATRKEQAAAILSSYGQTNRASFVFSMLDDKPLTEDQLIKLMWQVLKK